MCDQRDTLKTIEILRSSLKNSFLFQEQFRSLISVLDDVVSAFLTNEKAESNQLVPQQVLFQFLCLLDRLKHFIRMNFSFTDRTPKDLPLLRMIQTFLSLSTLYEEYCDFVNEFRRFVEHESMNELFQKKVVTQAFDQTKMKTRRKCDLEDAVSKFERVLQRLGADHPEHAKIVSDLNIVLRVIKKKKAESRLGFLIFNQPMCWKLIIKVEKWLLSVNTHSGPQVSSESSGRGRLMKSDFVFSEEPLNQLSYEGKFGKIFYAKRKRKHAKSAAPDSLNKVCLQVLDPVLLSNLTGKENREFGYQLRYLEKQSTEKAEENCLVKIFGHAFDAGFVTRDQWTGKLLISMEHLDFSLRSLLKGNKVTGSAYKFEKEHLFHIFYSLSKALATLHEGGIIHRNVHTGNVFLTQSKPDLNSLPTVKLANFCYGLKEESVSATNKEYAYSAPEVLATGSYSYASDMYSLGIVMWEASHQNAVPFDYHVYSKTELVERILSGVRPDFEKQGKRQGGNKTPKPSHGFVKELTCQLWVAEPWKRPSARFLCNGFQKLFNSEELDIIGAHKKVLHTIVRRKNNLEQHKVNMTASKMKRKNKAIDRVRSHNPVQHVPPPVNYTLHASGRFSLSTQAGEKANWQSGSSLLFADNRRLTAASRMSRISVISRDAEQTETGVDGLTRTEIRGQLYAFCLAHDTAMVKYMDGLVERAFNKGLIGFHRQMLLRHGEGLKFFAGGQNSLPQAPMANNAAVGYDGIERNQVKAEVLEFWHTMQSQGISLNEQGFSVVEVVEEAMKCGLDIFHYHMRFRYGRGLKRYDEQAAGSKETEEDGTASEFGADAYEQPPAKMAAFLKYFRRK